jgi:hypothetical protein
VVHLEGLKCKKSLQFNSLSSNPCVLALDIRRVRKSSNQEYLYGDGWKILRRVNSKWGARVKIGASILINSGKSALSGQ